MTKGIRKIVDMKERKNEACKIMPLKERTLAEILEDKVLTSDILHFILECKIYGCYLSAYLFKEFTKEKKLKIIMIGMMIGIKTLNLVNKIYLRI